ncbi:MAG: hypothetical protein VX206_07090 [Pseudomonadota bacterium]|nr:hypothetical protein [Pseudomonadota bacterium]
MLARNGLVVRVITELVNPADNFHKVYICNDITSFSGNVELMSMS